VISFKPDVKMKILSPQLVLAIFAAHEVFNSLKLPFVITSMTDGKHMPKSKHYLGGAVDIRISSISLPVLSTIVVMLRDSLTDDFDVILEKTHLHIEYDPKE